MRPCTCRHSLFNGGAGDPRTLVYRYQQELREQLLAKAYAEEHRPAWWSACSLALIDLIRLAFVRQDPVPTVQL